MEPIHCFAKILALQKNLYTFLKERYNTVFKEEQRFISLHSHNEKHFVEKLEPSFFEQTVVYASDAGNARL